MGRKANEIYFGEIKIEYTDFWFLTSKGRFYLRSKLEEKRKPIEEHELVRTVNLNHGFDVKYVSPTLRLLPQQHWDLEDIYQDFVEFEIAQLHEKKTKRNK